MVSILLKNAQENLTKRAAKAAILPVLLTLLFHPSEAKAQTDTNAPPVPDIPGTSSVILAWSPSISTNVAGYKIYYGLASGVYNNSISVGISTNATVFGLEEGITYYFAATALDALGIESQFSNETSWSVPPQEAIEKIAITGSSSYMSFVPPPSGTTFPAGATITSSDPLIIGAIINGKLAFIAPPTNSIKTVWFRLSYQGTNSLVKVLVYPNQTPVFKNPKVIGPKQQHYLELSIDWGIPQYPYMVTLQGAQTPAGPYVDLNIKIKVIGKTTTPYIFTSTNPPPYIRGILDNPNTNGAPVTLNQTTLDKNYLASDTKNGILQAYVKGKPVPIKSVETFPPNGSQFRNQNSLLAKSNRIAPRAPYDPYRARSNTRDAALLATKGGIDFAESNLDLQIKRDGAGVPLPVSEQNLDNIHIDGLVPVILNIKPIQNVPLFSKMMGGNSLETNT